MKAENNKGAYQEALDYIYAKLPMFTRIGAAAYKPNLDNTIKLCKELGNPENGFKSIHIAGTNGKGSVSHMLAAIFQEAGYKTGLYTSPHLVDFRERIRINGEQIPETVVTSFIENLKPFIEKEQPSFFEITVGMAFDYFAKEKVDIAIIEVGLGGLLDSTNVITPELSVITNISLDHTALLGNTKVEIAVQKAGIIKEHVPVVIGEADSELERVFFTKTVIQKSPLFYSYQLFDIVKVSNNLSMQEITLFSLGTQKTQTIRTDLLGSYQAKNLRTVLTAVEVMKQLGWKLSESHIQSGLSSVRKITGLRGRFEVVRKNPTIICDVSHNEDGIRNLVQQLSVLQYRQLHVVCGFVADKDISNILSLLPTQAVYYFSQAQIPRALPYTELHEKGTEAGLNGKAFSTITSAIKEALCNLNTDDVLLVSGSFFILEEAYQALEVAIQPPRL